MKLIVYYCNPIDKLSYQIENAFNINELSGGIGRINGINIEGTYTTYTMDDRLSDYTICERDTIYRRSDIDDNCCFPATSIIEHRIWRETIRDIAIGNDKTDSTTSNDDGFEKYFKYKKGKRL